MGSASVPVGQVAIIVPATVGSVAVDEDARCLFAGYLRAGSAGALLSEWWLSAR